MLLVLTSALLLSWSPDAASSSRCLRASPLSSSCLDPPGKHGTCRIHTDTADWEDYPWRNAYSLATDGSFVTHEYAFCSNGTGPWAFTSTDLNVSQCMAKAKSLGAKCFDYMCEYHPFANCTCPATPPVTPTPRATQVAAVGDSITAGYLSSCGLNYPNQLQSLLGSGFKVTNYGVGGTTLLRKGDNPYWNTPAFKAASTSDADIVIIALGTNDAKTQNWQTHSADYPSDYKALIEIFKAMPSKPEVHIAIPPPLYRDGVYGMLQEVVNTELPKLIPTIARDNGLAAPVDVFSLFQTHCPVTAGTPGHPPNSTDVVCDWIGSGGRDACHPDDYGYLQLAKAVRAAIAPGDATAP
jgi:lysophospholipase L1-like esterase